MQVGWAPKCVESEISINDEYCLEGSLMGRSAGFTNLADLWCSTAGVLDGQWWMWFFSVLFAICVSRSNFRAFSNIYTVFFIVYLFSYM